MWRQHCAWLQGRLVLMLRLNTSRLEPTHNHRILGQALKPFGMQLAYCNHDQRRIEYIIDELKQLNDLFFVSFYSIDPPSDPDENGKLCTAHIITMHGSTFYDTAKSVTMAVYVMRAIIRDLKDKRREYSELSLLAIRGVCDAMEKQSILHRHSLWKVKDRPLIVAHPGAHMNYLASWNVMVDNEAPFVLVCDDLSPAYPDGWWSSHSQNNSEYFARISNPQGIGQAYRNPDLGFQNLLIHRETEAKKGAQGLSVHRHHVHRFS